MTIWQSPHFFALSLFRREDYERANLAVLIVRRGLETTLRRIVLHIPPMLLCTVFLSLLGVGGALYLVVTTVVGIIYLAWAIQAQRGGEKTAAAWGKRLFHFSYVYLLVVFLFALF